MAATSSKAKSVSGLPAGQPNDLDSDAALAVKVDVVASQIRSCRKSRCC